MSDPSADELRKLNENARAVVRAMFEDAKEVEGIDMRHVVRAASFIEAQLPVHDREGAVRLRAALQQVFGPALAEEQERG